MTNGTLLLVSVALFALFVLYVICLSFYTMCIKGFDPTPAAQPCESLEAQDVPGKIWDAIQPIGALITTTGATPLGFLKLHAGPMRQFSSVWWADEGRVVMYGSASQLSVAGNEDKAFQPHTTCSSALADGTQIQTLNHPNTPSTDTDRFRIRAFPARMSPAALLEIHRARLSRESLPTRPVEPSLDRIVAINNAVVIAIREDMERAVGARTGADGRQRASPRVWLKETVKFLPPVGTILRFTRRARARRELKDLGLLHLWKKP